MQGFPRSTRFLFLAAALTASGVRGAELFAAHQDIGAPALAGNVSVREGRYIVQAAGANMMGAHDELHFVWRRMTGDFTLSARVLFAGPGVAAHRKAGLMARAGLGDAAAYVDAAVHGNGPSALQVRRDDGGPTEMLILPGAAGGALPKLVRLERHGGRFTVSIAEEGQPEVRRELADAGLPATLYIGLFLCAHQPDVIETAVFDQVQLIPE